MNELDKLLQQREDQVVRKFSKQSENYSKLKSLVGSEKKLQAKVIELESLVAESNKALDTLKDQKNSLTAWIRNFEENTRSDMERRFRADRNRLLGDIKKLQKTKIEESESIQEIIAAQRANDNRVARQAESMIMQNKALDKRKEDVDLKVVRANQIIKDSAMVTVDLDKRRDALDVRERKLSTRESGILDSINELKRQEKITKASADKAKRAGDEARKHTASLQAAQAEQERQRHSFRNEAAALKEEVRINAEKLNAQRVELHSFVARERKVKDQIDRLKLKGISVG